MQSFSQPITKDLVLIGGGHSHAIALKQFGMNPIAGVKLTLITDVSHTPYSGMLPGYVAGLYRFDQCHIDLRPLSQFAGARMIVDRAIGLDLPNHRVLLADRPPIAFDLLSIDIGSTPAACTVPGAADYAIAVKPISKFLQRWDQLVEQLSQAPAPLRLAIVGGGAGGVELALAIQARIQRLSGATESPRLEMHLIHRGERLMPERHRWVGDRLQQILTQRDIQVHLRESVVAVDGDRRQPMGRKKLRCESGLTLECDEIFWVTQAAAASWLKDSGLATDEQGFIQISDTLQSISHPQVFAAGDVATLIHHPRPKAGVFAVRQGKPLARNLRRALLGQPLRRFVPQKEFLILVGTGDRSAVASRGRFGFGPQAWLWQWKDAIDRQFMQKFSELQPMMAADPTNRDSRISIQDSDFAVASSSAMPCAGCGSKVSSTVLEKAIARIQQHQPDWSDRDDILIGLEAPDDAAVIQVPADRVLVQTIDYFRALIDDPFLFGQIAANHCLSDIFAMGADPQSGLAIVTLPYAAAAQQEEMLYQLLSGAVQVLNQADAPLIGGHTTQGSELAFGLTCNGIAPPHQLWRKSGMQPGQVLVLTKALGTGTLFAADMRLQAKGRWIEAAIRSMLLSNQAAAHCLRQHQATACTDVTGFGLVGHLLEMVRASGVSVDLDLSAIPVLEGAPETIEQKIFSSLYPQNLRAARHIANLAEIETAALFPLLFDPQTSGGLLAAIPAEQASACLACLTELGYGHSRMIGQIHPPGAEPPITISQRGGKR